MASDDNPMAKHSEEAHLEPKARPISASDLLSSPGALPSRFQAWTQVLSAFLAFFNTWGLLLAFGALQTHYEQHLLRNYTSSEISWIATTSGFLLLASGLITGPLYDYGYLRTLLVTGSILEVLGLMMTSLAHKYYQVFLAQGVCIGLGGGMLYVPSTAAAATSFNQAQRPLAMGIVASGAGVGGVVYPIIFRRLEPQLGFPWTIRIMAFVMLTASTISLSVIFWKPRKSPMIRQFVDIAAFKDLPYLLFVLAGLFGAMGYYIPLVYLTTFAETHTDVNTDLAFYLLAIINGTSTVGRILAGVAAKALGLIEMTAIALGCCSVLLFSWIAVHGTASVVVLSVLWGLFSSVIVALPGATIPLLSPSIGVVGTRTGMYWGVAGLGVLIGSPVAGKLIVHRPTTPVWWHLQAFAGCSMVVGTALLIYPMLYAARRRRRRGST